MMPTCATELRLLVEAGAQGKEHQAQCQVGESLLCPLLGQPNARAQGAHHVVKLLGPAGPVVVPGEVLGLLQDDDLCARLLSHTGQIADLEDPQQRPVISPCTPCCAQLPALPLTSDAGCSAMPSVA